MTIGTIAIVVVIVPMERTKLNRLSNSTYPGCLGY
jgi:hypothetical protein